MGTPDQLFLDSCDAIQLLMSNLEEQLEDAVVFKNAQPMVQDVWYEEREIGEYERK